MQKFIVISAAMILGGKTYKNGDVIELDEAQAERQFYKQRTRPASAAAAKADNGAVELVAELEAQLESADARIEELEAKLAKADATNDELTKAQAKAPTKK